MKKHFKITIIQNDGRDCTVKVEEWKNGRWALFDIFDSILIVFQLSLQPIPNDNGE